MLLLYASYYRLSSKYVEMVKQVCAFCADTSFPSIEMYCVRFQDSISQVIYLLGLKF